MSKTQLKKLMSSMSHEQIMEMVLDLYAARKEAKEYLDFFVKPDIDEKLKKAKAGIQKEAKRTSRGFARPRMTKIRRFISDIASLNPGAEPVLDIMIFALEEMCGVGSRRYLKEATSKNVAKLLRETMRMSDRAGLLNISLPKLHEIVSSMNYSDYYLKQFANLMRETLQNGWEND